MKTYKQLICGILIGAAATLSITALADFIINPNPYPVKVNGQTVQIEGYNINDSTYFKLRDIAQAVGGFDVDFKDGAVVLQTPDATPTSTPVPTPTPTPVANTAKPTPNPKLPAYRYDENTEFTSDGLPIEVLEDGNKYVYTGDIETVYNFRENGYSFGVGHLYKEGNIIIDNIQVAPQNIKNNSVHISIDYYESTFLPSLKKN